ncbi:MAG: hypothetical protein J4215_01795 [Candidatus Diapherotrites archaeon]|uniref:PEP-utilising enzyme mobile domain-containing protein n=1 Tax=Candidatus Iainarchaeum sp. TaxID=3101447 RepID=A0A8T4LD96_9ARCH|nr:hypothetical protein [Candidatus Diapherotrites archaeon]
MIQKKVGEQKLGGSFTEYFSALTAPVHLSFINDVEIEILQVAQKVQKKPGLKRAFLREDPDEISRELKKNPSIQHAIQSLQDKFFWSKNNYVHDNRLDTAHFIREIQEILRQHTDILGHIEKIKNTPIQNRKEKEKLFKKLEIDGTLKALIRLNEDFTYWQDERKKATYWGTHYLGVLLEEIGKRTGYTVDEIKYFTPSEVHHVFEKKDWHAELAARKKGCVIHWDETRFEVLSGAKYQKFKKDFRGHTDYAHLTELKGLTACLGKVQGTVKRVLSATEVGKVEKGDILVAVMTRPDYIVAMKKAAAIVTNEGGITSHAAIVSRELKIPCVIGTKIATNALHDGDLIEVDADNGIIRILKRASQ